MVTKQEMQQIRDRWPDLKDLGGYIKKTRKRLGWSQFDLFQKSGVSTTVICAFERGKRAPSLENECKIVDAIREGRLAQKAEPEREIVFNDMVPLKVLSGNPEHEAEYLRDRAEALRLRAEKLSTEAEEESDPGRKAALLRRVAQCLRQAVQDTEAAIGRLESAEQNKSTDPTADK